MTGCFGNDAEDRWKEDRLLKHTDPPDLCPVCGEEMIDCYCENQEDANIYEKEY